MKLIKVLLPSLALGATAAVLAPTETDAFVTNGSVLLQAQRDFRIFNDFDDASANNNQVADPNFPGYKGAVMAIWKGCVEWGSEWHGTGAGDPYQGNVIGSGQANFDPSFQAEALGVGGLNDNIHSPLKANNPGVYAFAEGPYSDGWRVRYYENPWIWQDGPGNNGGSDLQGIACHEYGHCIGLGHSVASGNPTMQASTATGLEQRSINFDDVDGVQAVYGVKSASKPRITGISVDEINETVTITGLNFSANGNQVWFTQALAGGNGNPIKVTNVVAINGGTEITVGFPTNSGPGDVLVRNNGTGNANLSNAWPIDVSGDIIGGGGPTITSVVPATKPAVVVDPQVNSVLVNGTGFTGTSGVRVDGISLFAGLPPDFFVHNDNQIEIINFPLVSTVGLVDIEVEHPLGNAVTQIDIVVNDPPVVELTNSWDGASFPPTFINSADGLQIALGSDVGDGMYLFFSGSSAPSVFPGYVNFDIGNNFAELFFIGAFATPISGYTYLDISLNGSFAGVTWYFQAGVIDASGLPTIYPLTMTNTQTALFFF